MVLKFLGTSQTSNYMLRPRVIPCLLVHNKGLVKTVKFEDPKYVGDPINAVKIFNEKEVDELMVLDIDATVDGREPNYEMIRNLAAECRMPLCYGGGVSTVEQAVKIINSGVEKVAISAAAVNKPKLIQEIAKAIGSQSVVVVIDIKKKGLLGRYEIFTHRGKKQAKIKLKDFLQVIETAGVGEVVVNSIDQEGTMKGYDHKLIGIVREAINVPMTVLGGAGSLADIKSVFSQHGVIGAAAGSLFVFKGKYRAVLINYPQLAEKQSLYPHTP